MPPKIMLRVLVTGAAGFIGSHVIKGMLDGGHEVFGVDIDLEKVKQYNHLSGTSCNAKCHWISLNLENTVHNQNVLSQYMFDGVIHCASRQPRAGLTFDDYYRGNVLLLTLLLDVVAERQSTQFITFSSAAVYGSDTADMLDEKTPPKPVNFYGLSKHVMEEVLKIRSREEGLNIVCLRMPSVYGTHQGGGLVETYFESAYQGRDIEVYGGGQWLRSLLHVDDIVAVCRMIIERTVPLRGYQLFVLGSGDALTMEEIAKIIAKKMRSSSRVVCIDTPSTNSMHWKFKIDRIREVLKYEPMNIETGLDRYLNQMGRL